MGVKFRHQMLLLILHESVGMITANRKVNRVQDIEQRWEGHDEYCEPMRSMQEQSRISCELAYDPIITACKSMREIDLDQRTYRVRVRLSRFFFRR